MPKFESEDWHKVKVEVKESMQPQDCNEKSAPECPHGYGPGIK